MIIGNGLLAHSLQKIDRDTVTFFASGVSNSAEENNAAYERELQLLEKQNKDCLLVYFSTTSVHDPTKQNTKYIQHKLNTEAWINKHFPQHLICRLPNMVGPEGNPHTLIPYFKNSIKNGDQVSIFKNATRRLMDVAQLPSVIEILLDAEWRGLINAAPEKVFSVKEIYLFMVQSMRGIPNYLLTEGGASYDLEVREFNQLLHDHHFALKNSLEEIILAYL